MAEVLNQALLNPAVYPHPVDELELVETHISWVILTGPYAYKIKKPVDLGFLDFASLAKRKFYCERELELNKRLAPKLYLGVIRITGKPHKPAINGEGDAIEYAVKMAQFPQDVQLDRMLHAGDLLLSHITDTADKVAEFHQDLAQVDTSSDYGRPERVLAPVKENFRQIRQRDCGDDSSGHLENWVDQQFSQLAPLMAERKEKGFIRECHGDIHLRNVAWHEEEIVIFDCIEFSDELRFIDVISEVAFMVMDLDDRDRPDLSSWFINRYLEHTGDYAGLQLLRFYMVYRALVRAKVDCIRANQDDVTNAEHNAALEEYQSYLQLASKYIQPHRPIIVLMFGLSGSGKTYVSDQLLQAWPAIRLRSDVERKRLHGLDQKDRTGSGPVDAGIYSESASRQTYTLLCQQAKEVLGCGYNVIIDAAFLYSWQRSLFLELARANGYPLLILECVAPKHVLEQRLSRRTAQGRDASDANSDVLQRQLENIEPLNSEEIQSRLSVDTEHTFDVKTLSEMIQRSVRPSDVVQRVT